MERVFRIILVDDQPADISTIIDSAALILDKRHGYKIEYSVISTKEAFEKINEQVADIVMFDYNLSAANFVFEESSRYGYVLIEEFRKLNRRTKIIFYSSRFDMEDPDIDLSASQLVYMVNELSVFKIISKSSKSFVEGILSAIADIDTVLISVDELINLYGDDGIFTINGQELTGPELLVELKKGTPIGDAFRVEVTSTILNYLMKFGGADE